MLVRILLAVQLGVVAVDPDPNGYLFFCLCMGRLGNQIEHFLGGLSFAKKLNRTLVLPPFRTYKNQPFDSWFKVEPLLDYHRVILASDFMQDVAPTLWPVQDRVGFCLQLEDAEPCEMKDGNPFEPFWTEQGVDFTFTVRHIETYQDADLWLERVFDFRYPATLYPVLALKGAPAAFPMLARDLHQQQYLAFSQEVEQEADSLLAQHFNGSTEYIAVHFRNGPDWMNACELVDSYGHTLMSAYQCTGFDGSRHLTHDMCLPSERTILNHIETAVRRTGIINILIATDQYSMVDQISKISGVNVQHPDPWLPVVDLALLSRANLFIGNCVSSFSAFVWRHREYHNLGPTEHFGVT